MLESLSLQIKRGNKKIRLLERNRQIFRLKRGLYVCSPKTTGKTLSIELIANHFYTPSYVSISSDLCYYGLIREAAYTLRSMALKHARNFDTPLSRFVYTHISNKAFKVGLTIIKNDDYAFVMTTPEKALCNLIANSIGVNLSYREDAEIYLEEDIRMNAAIFEKYITVGKKAGSIQTPLKLLQK